MNKILTEISRELDFLKAAKQQARLSSKSHRLMAYLHINNAERSLKQAAKEIKKLNPLRHTL